MPAPTITALPPPPIRGDTPATFTSDAENFVAALPDFVTETNALAVYLQALESGTLSDKLAAIDALTWAANKLIYLTGTNTVASTDLTAAGRALLDDADAAAQRATLGLGALAVLATINGGNWSGTDLAIADGGTGASSASAAWANLLQAAVASDYRTGTDATKALTSDAAWDAADYVTLNDSGGNIAVDLATGLNFKMTMDGDYTLSAPSNGKPGQSGCIVLTQDGTGTQTLAYNSVWKFAGGTDPVLSTVASTVDILFYQVLPNGTDVFANLIKAAA